MNEANQVHQQITEAYNTYGQRMQAEIENQAANLANNYVEQAIDGSTESSPLHSEHVNSLVEEVKAPALADTLASEARAEGRKLSAQEAKLMKKLGSGLLRASEKEEAQSQLAKLREEQDLWKGLSDSYEQDAEAEKAERTEAFRDLLDAEALDVAEKSVPETLYDVNAKPAKIKKNKQDKAQAKADKKAAKKAKLATETQEPTEEPVSAVEPDDLEERINALRERTAEHRARNGRGTKKVEAKPNQEVFAETLGLDMDKKQAAADRQAEYRALRQQRQEELRFNNEFDRNEKEINAHEAASEMFWQALDKIVEARHNLFSGGAWSRELEDALMGELHAAVKVLEPEMSAADAEETIQAYIEEELDKLREQEAANNQPLEVEPIEPNLDRDVDEIDLAVDEVLSDPLALETLEAINDVFKDSMKKILRKGKSLETEGPTKRDAKIVAGLQKQLREHLYTAFPMNDDEEPAAYEKRISSIISRSIKATDDLKEVAENYSPNTLKAERTSAVKKAAAGVKTRFQTRKERRQAREAADQRALFDRLNGTDQAEEDEDIA